MYDDKWCIRRTFTKTNQISDEILNSHALKTALQVCTKEQTKERLTNRRTMCVSFASCLRPGLYA